MFFIIKFFILFIIIRPTSCCRLNTRDQPKISSQRVFHFQSKFQIRSPLKRFEALFSSPGVSFSTDQTLVASRTTRLYLVINVFRRLLRRQASLLVRDAKSILPYYSTVVFTLEIILGSLVLFKRK